MLCLAEAVIVFLYLFCLLLTVFPLYSSTCRRASRLWVFKSFATWGDTCLFRLWWKIVSRCLLKMNFKRCLNEKCGWQAVAGKHGRCVLHTGSAREMGKIPQTNKLLNVIPPSAKEVWPIADIFGRCHTVDQPSLAQISEHTPHLS